jgi:hypothetical protein
MAGSTYTVTMTHKQKQEQEAKARKIQKHELAVELCRQNSLMTMAEAMTFVDQFLAKKGTTK